MECIILMGVGIVIGIYIATQIERGISMRINNNKFDENSKTFTHLYHIPTNDLRIYTPEQLLNYLDEISL